MNRLFHFLLFSVGVVSESTGQVEEERAIRPVLKHARHGYWDQLRDAHDCTERQLLTGTSDYNEDQE